MDREEERVRERDAHQCVFAADHARSIPRQKPQAIVELTQRTGTGQRVVPPGHDLQGHTEEHLAVQVIVHRLVQFADHGEVALALASHAGLLAFGTDAGADDDAADGPTALPGEDRP